MFSYCKDYDFRAGRVIASFDKEFADSCELVCKAHAVFSGIDIEEIEVILHPNHQSNEDIGCVLLLYLKSQQKSDVIAAIQKLKNRPHVVSAEPDYYISGHVIPDDRYFRYLWGMQSIQAPLAWNFATGDKAVVVGILDSGIDYEHPDLVDNIVLALSEQDLFSGNVGAGGLSAMDFTGHGTHICGTIGAVGDNYIGVAGVCWQIGLASLKIGNGSFNVAAAIKAIDFAGESGIQILNVSWGSVIYSEALKFAIDTFDGLIIASSGNAGTDNDTLPIYPASYDSDNIIAVTAIERDGSLPLFANYGEESVDIAAPGREILSTDIGGDYTEMNGTSMAAPHVTGAAALLKSFRPDLSPLQIKEIILSSVDKNPALTNKVRSGGSLNIFKMMEIAKISS